MSATATTTALLAVTPPARSATAAAARHRHRSHRPSSSAIKHPITRGLTSTATAGIRRGPCAPPSAVARDGGGDEGAANDASLDGMLGGGLADALSAAGGDASGGEGDGDQVAEALGMRESLLGDASEAKARQAAMNNLGLLMASGQAGALNNISPDLLPLLLRLPSTAGNVDALRASADGVTEWKNQLTRGLLPSAQTPWPDDPIFREALLDALGDLDMARFTRQFPPVLDTLMKNILDILYVYEQQRVDEVRTRGDGERGGGRRGGCASRVCPRQNRRRVVMEKTK